MITGIIRGVKAVPRERLIIRDSFPVPFRNAMLWAEELDALSVYTDIAKDKFHRDMDQIRRPSTPALILMLLYGTRIDSGFADFMVSSLREADPAVRKAAWVGLGLQGKRLIRSRLREAPQFSGHFNSDCEKAKEWLAAK